MSLSLTFWGTRGSIPTPGPTTVRYGGNTPCVTLQHDGAVLVLDAGTGLRAAGRWLASQVTDRLDVDLLLSHTHWDHIQGLPFFRPLFRAGNRIAIYGPPTAGGASLAEVLRAQMAPPVFPIAASDVAADLEITEMDRPNLTLPCFQVRTVEACHPAPTLGFAIQPTGHPGSVIYLTDNELRSTTARQRKALVHFLRDCRLLVHDAMFFGEEADERIGWGHSTASEATELAIEAGCHHLALFHHDPDHDDEDLDRLATEATETRERLGGSVEISIATEGQTLRLED